MSVVLGRPVEAVDRFRRAPTLATSVGDPRTVGWGCAFLYGAAFLHVAFLRTGDLVGSRAAVAGFT